ncbi:MAG TPA: PAS domain S-box protein [Verrucomicrobiae bacterium]
MGQMRRADLEVRHDALVEAQAEVEMSRMRYAELYDGAPVGYVTLNQAGVIEQTNLMGAELLGFSSAQMSGHPLLFFLAKNNRRKFLKYLSGLRREPGRASIELELANKGGRPVAFVELVAIPSLARTEPPGSFQCALIDITARRQAEKELRDSEEKFRTLTSHAPVGIFLCDKKGDTVFVNDTWCTMTDYPAEYAYGKGWVQAVHPDDRERIASGWDEAVRNGVCSTTEFRFLRPDGEVIWVHGKAVQFKNAEDKFTGYIGTVADITERKHGETELKRARDNAQQANQAKDNFLAALSHELRTPLNPVLLLASDGAANPDLPPGARMDFDTIRKNIELEARLIDDMLDITRVAHGKLKLNFQPADAHSILHDAISAVQSDLERKKIELTLHLNAKRQNISGDATRLQQIFWNVLKNAVKFTPENGKISVETGVIDLRLVVKVSDTGIGMSADELTRIFDAFSQGTHSGFGGLGLGLAISHKLVELHHGSIRAFSKGKGRGATFVIELPFGQKVTGDSTVAKTFPSRSAPVSRPKKLAQKIRILLVEDHEPTRVALAHLLVCRNYKVETAKSLAEARTLANAQNFNLLISDIGLPDGNGCDLMLEFHKLHPMKGIALTGYGMDDDIARSNNAGFDAHLTKPVRMESLDSTLATVLATK